MNKFIMDFSLFEKILNENIFDNSKKKLIQKIADYPDRYIWLFRPTKPKAKILQNILQSNEICFWDALEVLFSTYFELIWFENLFKNIQIENDWKPEYLNLDQLFKKGDFVYFVEQKVRDDHDSSKKRGQIDNFEKKINELLKRFDEKELRAFTYFIDPSLIKNKKFYSEKISEISESYNIEAKILYWQEFWNEIWYPNIWNEIIYYLDIWKKKIPDLPTINFDEESENIFSEIKDIDVVYYRKIFNNIDICDEILPIISPNWIILKKLQEYFLLLSNENIKKKSIYRNLSQKIDVILNK